MVSSSARSGYRILGRSVALLGERADPQPISYFPQPSLQLGAPGQCLSQLPGHTGNLHATHPLTP